MPLAPGRLLALSALLLLAACSSQTVSTEGHRLVGVVALESAGIANYPDWPTEFPLPLVVPEEVAVSESFAAQVTSIGGDGCFYHADGAAVERSGSTAVITPYDRYQPVQEMFCAGVIVALTREVVLSFDAAGDYVVRVEGRKVNGEWVERPGGAFYERVVRVR